MMTTKIKQKPCDLCSKMITTSNLRRHIRSHIWCHRCQNWGGKRHHHSDSEKNNPPPPPLPDTVVVWIPLTLPVETVRNLLPVPVANKYLPNTSFSSDDDLSEFLISPDENTIKELSGEMKSHLANIRDKKSEFENFYHTDVRCWFYNKNELENLVFNG
jgi:hypothetical protein